MSSGSGFLHMVYFWMAPGAPEGAATEVADGCSRRLAGIPGVLRLAVGIPAQTPRDVVDNSYGVALLVEFADIAAHDVYQDHADHHKFIEECSKYWSRVQVFDSLIAPSPTE